MIITPHAKYLSEALDVIGAACAVWPDSRHLAQTYAQLLARSGQDNQALDACEAFLVNFGVDEQLMELALVLRNRVGVLDNVKVAGAASISLCMIVKNEEQNLARCLASLKPLVHEMIIVDTGSSDRTVDIATLFGARVYSFPWNGNFSAARNVSLEKARGNWLLVMDADEVISPQDYELISQAVQDATGEKFCWSVMTRNYTKFHPHGWVVNNGAYPREERAEGWHPSSKIRLFPNDSQVRFVGEVHEMLEPTARKAGYHVRDASFVVHHYGGLADSSGSDLEKRSTYFELGKQKLSEHHDDLPSIGELAVQAAELELYEEAIELWNRFLSLAPDAVVALFNKGFALMHLSRFTEALDVTRRALEIDPLHKEAAFNYGTCALYAGDAHEAVQRLERVIDRHSGHPPLLAILVVLHLATGQVEKAQTLLMQLRKINYSITDYIDARVSVLQSLGNQSRAISIINSMEKLNGGADCTL